MTGVSAPSLTFGRQRDYERLNARRHQGEGRLSRERARNSRLALAGFVVLGVALAVGVRSGWSPLDFGAKVEIPGPEPGSFAATHTGALLFSSLDGVICKQVLFDNDTGRFSSGKLVRCEEAEAAGAIPAEGANAKARALSMRGAFKH
jgi:hypothetical protein